MSYKFIKHEDTKPFEYAKLPINTRLYCLDFFHFNNDDITCSLAGDYCVKLEILLDEKFQFLGVRFKSVDPKEKGISPIRLLYGYFSDSAIRHIYQIRRNISIYYKVIKKVNEQQAKLLKEKFQRQEIQEVLGNRDEDNTENNDENNTRNEEQDNENPEEDEVRVGVRMRQLPFGIERIGEQRDGNETEVAIIRGDTVENNKSEVKLNLKLIAQVNEFDVLKYVPKSTKHLRLDGNCFNIPKVKFFTTKKNYIVKMQLPSQIHLKNMIKSFKDLDSIQHDVKWQQGESDYYKDMKEIRIMITNNTGEKFDISDWGVEHLKIGYVGANMNDSVLPLNIRKLHLLIEELSTIDVFNVRKLENLQELVLFFPRENQNFSIFPDLLNNNKRLKSLTLAYVEKMKDLSQTLDLRNDTLEHLRICCKNGIHMSVLKKVVSSCKKLNFVEVIPLFEYDLEYRRYKHLPSSIMYRLFDYHGEIEINDYGVDEKGQPLGPGSIIEVMMEKDIVGRMKKLCIFDPRRKSSHYKHLKKLLAMKECSLKGFSILGDCTFDHKLLKLCVQKKVKEISLIGCHIQACSLYNFWRESKQQKNGDHRLNLILPDLLFPCEHWNNERVSTDGQFKRLEILKRFSGFVFKTISCVSPHDGSILEFNLDDFLNPSEKGIGTNLLRLESKEFFETSNDFYQKSIEKWNLKQKFRSTLMKEEQEKVVKSFNWEFYFSDRMKLEENFSKIYRIKEKGSVLYDKKISCIYYGDRIKQILNTMDFISEEEKSQLKRSCYIVGVDPTLIQCRIYSIDDSGNFVNFKYELIAKSPTNFEGKVSFVIPTSTNSKERSDQIFFRECVSKTVRNRFYVIPPMKLYNLFSMVIGREVGVENLPAIIKFFYYASGSESDSGGIIQKQVNEGVKHHSVNINLLNNRWIYYFYNEEYGVCFSNEDLLEIRCGQWQKYLIQKDKLTQPTKIDRGCNVM